MQATRGDWFALLTGGLILAAVLLGTWEVVIGHTRYAVGDPRGRIIYLMRAFSTAVILAAWAGGYLLRSRSRLEQARTRLRHEESAFMARVRRSEQAAGLGAMTRLLAHELRDPLNGLALHCALLRRAVARRHAPEPVAELLENDVRRIEQLIDGYVSRHQHMPHVVRPVHLEPLVRSVLEDWPGAGAIIELAVAEGVPPVQGDPDRLRQLVENLLLDATGNGTSRVRIDVSFDGTHVLLEATADGEPFDQPAEVFRPFYVGRHSSLGLAIVRDVVREHGGDVSAANLPAGGTRIICRFSTGVTQ